MSVRPVPFHPDHAPALHALTLQIEQQAFTAHPRDLLPAVLNDPERLAVTILHGGRPVGLFALSVAHHRDTYLPQPDPSGVALGSLSLDANTQGQGVGTAMQALSTFVPLHFPQARRVLLVVNQRNPGARRVDEKAGFEVTGERQGPAGPQWRMHLPLPRGRVESAP